MFTLAFVTGLAGPLCFGLIPEPHRAMGPRPAGGPAPGLWGAVLGNRAFLGLVVSGFVWNLALQISAPFFNVYLVQHLGAGVGTVGLLARSNTLFGLLGSGLFGHVMDRLGPLRTQALCGLLIPFIPTA